MANILKQKLKHGIFSFYDNDKYVGKSLSEYGEWSESEVELIKGLVPKNEVIIEIGSNIGTHTVPLAKHLSNGGKIYAFEPQSQNHKLLMQNIKDNSIENVKISKIAISSKEGEAYMNTFANDKLSNYSAKVKNYEHHALAVSNTRLLGLCREAAPCSTKSRSCH